MKRRKYSFRKYKAPKYIIDSLALLAPPEDITVSEWAEKYRVLDEKSSNIVGPWRNMVTPYLTEIMDEFNNYETEEIVFVKPTQVGGTESMQNMLGFVIAQDPAPTMIVYPTEVLAKSTSINRLEPMIRASKALGEKYDARNSSNLELHFDSMYITLTGANTPSGLASKPIRYLFMDEIDKYPPASNREADPISLAEERTKTYPNRKIYKTSTPTLRTGPIWKAKEAADIEKHYFVPCPHCGEYIELKFAQLKWPDKEDGMSYADRAEFAMYICQECGAAITDRDKTQMLKRGRWQVVRAKTKFSKSVAFWINTLYSPFTRFSEIAKKFMESKDDVEKLHNFTNSWLAEPWEDTKLKTNADVVMDRQTDLPEFILPEWTRMLTAGVDVQENCLYYTIRAWGSLLTSQCITHGQAYSFSEIEKLMNIEYKTASGKGFLVRLALIDSGDQTDDVYEFCARNADWALPCKGRSPLDSHYRISTVNKAGSRAYGMQLVLVEGGKYKDMIASRMRRSNGTGAWMVFKGCDREYAEQVTAEHKVNEKSASGRVTLKWVIKSSHADNHYLDAEVYCACAADILGVRSLFLQEESEAAPEPVQPQDEQPAEDSSWINGADWLKQNNSWI